MKTCGRWIKNKRELLLIYRKGFEFKNEYGYYGYIQLFYDHPLFWENNLKLLSNKLEREVVYTGPREIDGDIYWYIGFVIRHEEFYVAEAEVFDVNSLLNKMNR